MIREQVDDFHSLCDIPTLETPQVPSDDRVRLRLRLVMEETLEFVTACLHYDRAASDEVERIEEIFDRLITEGAIEVDLPEAVDALGDIDYVVEGTRLEFGVDGGPVAAEIHRANMQKGSGPVRADGKRLKPPDFKPPDIAEVLRQQGWMDAERNDR